jgi:Tol biopolymer transport system component
MTVKRRTWFWTLVLLPLVLVSAVACGRVEVGVVETPAGSPDLAATVSALSTENARLATQAAPSPTTAQPPALGWLAWVQGGDVWVRHLPDGEPQRLTTDGRNLGPRWSPSGDWLAYRKGESQVWVYDLDGGVARSLNEGSTVEAFDWSPVADQIAYASGAELYVENADGTARMTVLAEDLPGPGRGPQGRIGGLEWSPTGQWIAYEWREGVGEGSPSYQGIWVVSPDGGVRGEAFQGDGTIAGWTEDGRYLLFWEGLFGSASLAADGVRLFAVSPEGGEPITVSKIMLPYADFVAIDPAGSDRVATVSGGGREAWTMKDLIVGSISAEDWMARSLPGQAASSPSWSLDGMRIAYAAMPAQDTGVMLQGEAARQVLMERRIWVLDNGSGTPTQLTEDEGYRDEHPLWSADGSTILFARLDENDRASVWMMPAGGGELEQVVEELTPAPGWFGYYGHIDWGTLFDWWRGEIASPSGGSLPTAAPYPTPQEQAERWEQLIAPSLVEDVTWAAFTGRIQAPDKGATWRIDFSYPAEWIEPQVLSGPPVSISVQNLPPLPPGPGEQDFVKFEVLWHDEAPAHTPDGGSTQCEWHTVEVAGTRGILSLCTVIPGRSRIVAAIFRLGTSWYSATGYITLPTEAPAVLDRYTATILEMIASLTMGD